MTWRALRRWHRNIALLLGGLFAFSGLTGAGLVYHGTLDRALNPGLLVASCETTAPLSLQGVMDAAISAGPRDGRVVRIDLPITATDPLKVRMTSPEAPQTVVLFIEPCSGRVMGRRGEQAGVVSVLYRAHHTLLLGSAGEGVLVGSAVLVLIMVVSGVLLWWPGSGRWRQALQIRWRQSAGVRTSDLHRACGVVAALFVAVASLTGVGMILQGGLTAAFADLGWLRPAAVPSLEGSDSAQPMAPLSLDAVVARALRAVPGDVRRVYPPKADDAVYRLIVRQPGDPRWSSGSGRVWIDGASGTIVDRRELADLRPAERLLTWLFPLHNGEAFGGVGKVLALAAGLSLPALYVTGLWLWWRRRTARRGSPSAAG